METREVLVEVGRVVMGGEGAELHRETRELFDTSEQLLRDAEISAISARGEFAHPSHTSHPHTSHPHTPHTHTHTPGLVSEYGAVEEEVEEAERQTAMTVHRGARTGADWWLN